MIILHEKDFLPGFTLKKKVKLIGFFFEGRVYSDIKDLDGRTMYEENKAIKVYMEVKE